MAKQPKITTSTRGQKTRRKQTDPMPSGAIGSGTSVTGLPTAELKARDARIVQEPQRPQRTSVIDDGEGPGQPPVIPPGQIFHDFSKDRLGPFSHTRGSAASGTAQWADEKNIITSSNTPIYTGDRLNPPSTWYDELVCYGIQVEPYSENHLYNSDSLTSAQWLRDNVTVDTNVITATADGGTLSQAFNLGSAKAYVFSGYVESVNGAAAIEVSGDGSTWQKIDLVGRVRFALPTLLATGACSIRLYNAGDQVLVRWAQFEPALRGQPTSWIPTYANAPAARGRVIVDTPGTGDGATNNFSLQVTATALGDSSKHPEDGAPFFSLVSTDYSARLTCYHAQSGTVDLMWEQGGTPKTFTGPALATAFNDAVDVRVRKSSDEGLVLTVNGDKASFPTLIEFSDPPLKRLRVGGDADDTALHEFQWIRFDPTGDTQAEVDGWPTWTQPLPVITEQPQNIAFGVTPIEPVTIVSNPDNKTVAVGASTTCTVGVTGDTPIYYVWTYRLGNTDNFESIDSFPGGTTGSNSNSLTILSMPSGTVEVQCTVDNDAGSPQTSTPPTTLTSYVPIASTTSFCLLFSDLIDGVNQGWDGSETKGAFVTLWGKGFGTDKTKLDIKVGGVSALQADMLAPGPSLVPWIDMVGFYLNSSMPLGEQQITITHADTGDTTADLVNFTVRNTGRIRFFNAGHTQHGDGSLADPFRNLGELMSGSTDEADRPSPGDHYYLREGTDYVPAGESSGRVLFPYGSRAYTGELGNSVSFSSYPGEFAVLRCATPGETDTNPCIGSMNTPSKDHYTFSRMDLYGQNASASLSGASFTRCIGVQGNGCHNSNGTGDFVWGRINASNIVGNNGHKVLGSVSRNSTSNGELDHAFYPGGAEAEVAGEFAYNYVYGHTVGGGTLLAYNSDQGGSRIVPGESTRTASIHHCIIDTRDPRGGEEGYSYGGNGVEANVGDNRDDSQLAGGSEDPDAPGRWSDPLMVYNNIFIADTRGDNYAVGAGRGVRETRIENNIAINFGSNGAFAPGYQTPPTATGLHTTTYIRNNLTISGNLSHRYAGDGSRGVETTTIMSGNVYYGGKPDSILSYDSNPIEGVDPKLTYNIDALSTPWTLAWDSPCTGHGTDVGNPNQTRDINGRPYSNRFDSGAVIADTVDLLFDSDFNNTPDWHSGMDESNNGLPATNQAPWTINYRDGGLGPTVPIPNGWLVARQQPVWAPSLGDSGDVHETIYVHSDHADKARPGNARCFVQYREAKTTGPGVWLSDGMLLWQPEHNEELVEFYCEFYIQLSPEMVASYYGTGPNQRAGQDTNDRLGMGTTKLYRAYYWDGDPDHIFNYFGGASSQWNDPKFLTDLGGSLPANGGYGSRNIHAYRGRTLNSFSHAEFPLTRNSGSGDCSLSWSGDRVGQAAGQTTADMLDKKANNGTFIPTGTYDNVDADQVFGAGNGVWTKMAFYQKMNSAPGVPDGKMMHWMDDKRILYSDKLDWVNEGESMVGWKLIGIGGNSYFDQYPDEDRHEEWYAIDEFKIYRTIPGHLSGEK